MLLVVDMALVRFSTLCTDEDIEVPGQRRLAHSGCNGNTYGFSQE